VALPTNFITDSNNSQRNNLIIIFSLGVAAVFGVGYLVSHRIIQPILHLVKTSQAIARGDLSKRTGLQRDDEIGILANTFDNMTVELQKKTAELEEEASKLNAILSSIADGVLVQDLAGNIIRMNPAARQILEAVGGDMRYLHQHQVVPPPNTTLDGANIPLLNELTGLEFHAAQRFEVGRRVLSAISAPVVTSDNEQLGAVVVLRDITREVESERLKDDFITSMSHELRTPLTAIKGYNDLLKFTAQAQLNEKQQGFIASIEENVVDLLNLIQGVLDLSQIEGHTLGIDQEELSLSALISQEVDNWQDDMEMKELTLRLKLPKEAIWVEGDWNRLSRVMQHLLKNAYDYTLPPGRVEVWLKAENWLAQVKITDTGVGIAKEDQKFLFTRFYRAVNEAHGEEIHEVSGAGIGLYMSKAIVEAHGGQMWVESDLHKGSAFYFTIPTCEAHLEEANEEDEDEEESLNSYLVQPVPQQGEDEKSLEYFEPKRMQKSEL
jgi:PAS domain S-box-containing protein